MTGSNATRVLTVAIPGLLGLGAVSALVGGLPWLSVAMVLVALAAYPSPRPGRERRRCPAIW